MGLREVPHLGLLMTIAGECSGIDDFPQAYSYLDTPYPDTDFPTEVREACLRRSAVGADVRAAKVIVVGDVSVGKTCLITKFCHEVYDANYKATIGVDFEVEKFSVLHVPFSLQIWDTAGQERFRSITSAYYRGAQVVILVFDLSLASSLYNTPKWLEETLESNGGHDPLRFLVGTKKDLVSDGVLDGMEEDATKIARRLDAEYWSVSAKSGENVRQLFFRVSALSFVKCLTRELQEKVNEGPVSGEFVRLRKRKQGKKLKAPKCSGKQSCSK